MTSSRGWILVGFGLLVAGTIPGALVSGFPPGLTAFPPLVEAAPDHPRFHPAIWSVFAVLGLLAAAVLMRPGSFGFSVNREPLPPRTVGAFPWWGWIGLVLNLAAWVIAWTRPAATAGMNDLTFFPLWLGWILFLDAWVHRRSGTSLLTRSPRAFWLLFPVSAVSWWTFEFLNRFVRNWWYEGAEAFTPAGYIVHASLCFATVLPAILETRDALMTTTWFQRAYREGPSWPSFSAAPGLSLVGGVVLLSLVVAYPVALFFLLWVAPLLILFGAVRLSGTPHPLGRLDRGDWTLVASLAVAALACGFLWELWNMWSLPKWNYDVPFVMKFLVFEMPVVGYAGYLPFGPICWLFVLAWSRFFRSLCASAMYCRLLDPGDAG